MENSMEKEFTLMQKVRKKKQCGKMENVKNG